MKTTNMMIVKGTEVQFAAVQIGEKVRVVRESLGWPMEKTLTFSKDEGEDLSDYAEYFDLTDVKAVIEYQPKL